jgi:hypothetical protein
VSTTLVQFDFPWDGPWGEGLEAACRDLAADIAAEPGLRFKLWGENEPQRRASGVYLFEDAGSAERYLRKHRERLGGFGVGDVVAHCFAVNGPLSRATRAQV